MSRTERKHAWCWYCDFESQFIYDEHQNNWFCTRCGKDLRHWGRTMKKTAADRELQEDGMPFYEFYDAMSKAKITFWNAVGERKETRENYPESIITWGKRSFWRSFNRGNIFYITK